MFVMFVATTGSIGGRAHVRPHRQPLAWPLVHYSDVLTERKMLTERNARVQTPLTSAAWSSRSRVGSFIFLQVLRGVGGQIVEQRLHLRALQGGVPDRYVAGFP